MRIEVTNPILLVENEPLIAMDVEAMLRAAGFEDVVHVVSSGEALEWLDRFEAGVVILDLIVRDGPTAPVAERLRARGAPFLVYSGLSRAEIDDAAVFDDVIWLSKPCTQSELVNALERSLRLPFR